MTTTGSGNGNGTRGVEPPKTIAVPARGEVVQRQVPQKPINVFRDLLTQMKSQIALALPKHIDIDRMLRIVLTTVQRTPKLLDCTQESLLGCIVQCAQLGLEPDGLLGHAYLIPFNNRKQGRVECQLIVGYKGLLKLARQSGEIASISARIVREKDEFRYQFGLHEDLVHVPYVPRTDDEKDTAGPPVFAYAIFRLKDGSHHFDVMGWREIERIRLASPSAESDAWTEHWDEMAKKTVLRRASKMSPASIEDRMAKAIALDERAQAGLPQDLGDTDGLLTGETAQGAIAAAPPTSQPAARGLTQIAAEAKAKREADSGTLTAGAQPQPSVVNQQPGPPAVSVPTSSDDEDRRGDDPLRSNPNARPDDDDVPPWAGGKGRR